MRTSFDDIVSATSQFSATPRSGTEKRLEADFAQPHRLLSGSDWQLVVDKLDVAVISENFTDGLLSIICNDCVICVTESRIVILSATKVPLHLAPRAIQKVCAKHELDIQWMSFMRKNTCSMWSQGDKSVGAEYVELKRHFSKGHAYIFGPADKDHYFYFVYDNIMRHLGVVENDIQINVVMYDIAHPDPTEDLIPKHVVKFGKGFHGASSLGNGEYEVLRVDEIDGLWCASFETNKAANDYSTRIKSLLTGFRPQRFSLTVLTDPLSCIKSSQFSESSLGPGAFDGFKVVNRTSNEFAQGYTINKLAFVSK